MLGIVWSILFAIAGVNSFNVENITNSLVLSSNDTTSLFGFSITYHENAGEKSLIIDAPGSNNSTRSNATETEESSGLHNCKLLLNPLRSFCSTVDVSLNDPNEILYECDLEKCTLEQLSIDDFNWTRTNRPTPSDGTGPNRDHTFENSTTSSGYYMFMEASARTIEISGQSAIVATPTQQPSLGDCVRFWYHMYGEKITNLNVYVQTAAVGMVMIWTKNGNQGNQWIEGHVTVISEQPYQILFEAIREQWLGDIGIDDIVIKKGQCIEDLVGVTGTKGSTLITNPKTKDTLTCNPTWKFNCSGQMHASGACYLLNNNFTTSMRSIITPFKKQVCSSTQVDIVFIIDSSHSVSANDFDYIKMWLRNVISSLPIGPGLAQVGMMIYSGKPRVIFYLNKYPKIEDLRKAIENMTFTGGNTHTGQAIDEAINKIFRAEHGMRTTAKHVAIVMTDGKSQDDVVGPSNRAKAAGVTLFAIGVGKANDLELRNISSDPEKYLFTINDYSALGEIKNSLQESIASLESQGKTSTTEQGSAGFSALFYGDIAIIGSPGLNDWSGGYSTYSVGQKNENQSAQRSINTFTELLRNANPLQLKWGSQRNTKAFNINQSPSGSNISSSQFSSFDSYEGSSVSFNQSNEGLDGFGSGSSVPFHINQNISESLTSEELKKIELYAYFGYSVASGKFLNNEDVDLLFGAPRAESRGMVFIVRHNFTHESGNTSWNNPVLMGSFRSEQMGSYFGFSLCATDTNGDGIDEIIVGAPLWMDRQVDEGRVFVFLSEFERSSGLLKRKKLDLKGNSAQNSRFGYSLATPGDLNFDGFNDVIVGAPSNNENSGVVFVYYGRPCVGISQEKYQAIRAQESRTTLTYFGFSVISMFDVDGNGYNDIAVGAPGNGKVLILLSRPVIHVNVDIAANPSVLNVSHIDSNFSNHSHLCDRNATHLCASIRACMFAYGRNISQEIMLDYNLVVDANVNRNERRGRVSNPEGEITLRLNETRCLDFELRIKIPLRQQLTALVSSFHFQLSKKIPSTNLSPVLDIFDIDPKHTEITFINSCTNNICLSDLNISCSVVDGLLDSSIPTVVMGSDQLLSFNVNLTNQMKAAYDATIDVRFSNSVYFLQSLPLYKKDSLCIESEYLQSGLSETNNGSHGVHNHQVDYQRIRFRLKQPVMFQHETCNFIVQFGFQKIFHGGFLNVSFSAFSESQEIFYSDNHCHSHVNVMFESDLLLQGLSFENQVMFSRGNSSNLVQTLSDIGPEILHNYTVFNVGPSAVPALQMNIQWPLLTKSKHSILHFVQVHCFPPTVCECGNLTFATNTFINETYSNNSVSNYEDVVEFGEFAESDLEVDSRTNEIFKLVSLSCENGDIDIVCANLMCRLTKLSVAEKVFIQLKFRLWQETFLQGRAWKVVIFSNAQISSNASPYIVDLKGKNNFTLFSQVKTEALNGDFKITEDEDTRNKTSFLIIALSVTVGILIWPILVVALKKFGFFESRYKEQMEEELEWQYSYQYTCGKQKEPNQDENISLTTFQRRQPTLDGVS